MHSNRRYHIEMLLAEVSKPKPPDWKDTRQYLSYDNPEKIILIQALVSELEKLEPELK